MNERRIEDLAEPSRRCFHPDLLISLLAAKQDGIVTWAQLMTLGIGRGVIARRVRRGSLRALHVGVYLWGTPTPSFPGRVRAAALAGGNGACASRDASAALWGFRPPPSGPIDASSRSATSPARWTGRAPRAGVRALKGALDEPAFTRSCAERRLVALLRAAKLPQPVFNALSEGFEVDAPWRFERVVPEFDAYAFHATKGAFVRDRQKSAALERACHVVLRTTWHELTRQSHALVARTAAALARARG